MAETRYLPLDTQKGDIAYEEKQGKLILWLKEPQNKHLLLDELFQSKEWRELVTGRWVDGVWDVAKTYDAGSVVSYEGALYQSQIANNTALIPTSNPSAWRCVVAKGTDAPTLTDIFERLGRQDLRIEITDDHDGIVVLTGEAFTVTLEAKVLLYFRDLSDRVVMWRWLRESGGKDGVRTTRDEERDRLWNEAHKAEQGQQLTIRENDLEAPRTKFICFATIDSREIRGTFEISE